MTRSRLKCVFASGVRHDERGSVLVEFALLAPAFLTLLIGVAQIGIQIQTVNAVRNLASDGARFAVVEYQLNRGSSTDIIRTWIRSRGIGRRYNLNTDRLNVTVNEVATSRITGTKEMRIQITYDAPEYLSIIPGNMFQVAYTRPVFLLQASAPPAPSS